jgi:F-type H+-transporting ATPase subunit alpha
MEQQVLVIFAGINGYLDGLEVNQVGEFQKQVLNHFDLHQKAILSQVASGKKMSPELQSEIKKVLDTFTKGFESNAGKS